MLGAGGTPRLETEINNYKGGELQEGKREKINLFPFILRDV